MDDVGLPVPVDVARVHALGVVRVRELNSLEAIQEAVLRCRVRRHGETGEEDRERRGKTESGVET
jgi:hypothetical protein